MVKITTRNLAEVRLETGRSFTSVEELSDTLAALGVNVELLPDRNEVDSWSADFIREYVKAWHEITAEESDEADGSRSSFSERPVRIPEPPQFAVDRIREVDQISDEAEVRALMESFNVVKLPSQDKPGAWSGDCLRSFVQRQTAGGMTFRPASLAGCEA